MITKVTHTYPNGMQVEYLTPDCDAHKVVASFTRDMVEGSILVVESL